MKINTGKFLLAAALTLFAFNANAVMVELSDTADFTGVNTVSATDGDNDGVVTNLGLGSWTLNMATGVSSPAIGTIGYVDEMHLNFLAFGGTGTVYVRLSDINFNKQDWASGAGVTLNNLRIFIKQGL